MGDPTEEISEVFVTNGAFFKVDLGNLAGNFIEQANESLISGGFLDDLSPYNQKRMKESMDNSVDEIIAKHAGKTFHADPFGISLGKDVFSDEHQTSSWRVGLGGQDGIRPELFYRTENHFSILGEDGAEPHSVTNSFYDMGYLNAEVSNPGERGTLYADPLSDHQKNISYFGGRLFNQHFANEDSELYSTVSGGLSVEGDMFAEGTLAYKRSIDEWDFGAAAQVSYSDETPQLDVKATAERYFDIPAIAGKFNAAVQGTVNPDQKLVTGFARVDLRPGNWEKSDNWFENHISAGFNAKAQWDGRSVENEYSVGVYTDVPLGRAGIEYDNKGSTAIVLSHPF